MRRNETLTDSLAAWRNAAADYTELNRNDPRKYELLLPALHDMLGDIRGQRIADLGCGPGDEARWMAEHGATVTGCDGVPSFVARAQELLSPFAGCYAVEHDLQLGLADGIFPSASFDTVTATMLVSSLSDLHPLFRSVARMLKPGGRFILSTLHPAFTPPAAKVHAGVLGRLHPRLRRVVVLDYFTEKRVLKSIQGSGVPPLPYHHRTLGTLISSLVASGLVVTDLREPRPSDSSAIARDPSLRHTLTVPLFVLLEAQPSR